MGGSRITVAMPKTKSSTLKIHAAPQMLEYRAAVDRIASDGHQRILDWGCGLGQLTRLLTDRGLGVTSFDYAAGVDGVQERALELYPGLTATVSSDPRLLPFPDNAFDAVLSMGVLEHVEDPDASLDEIRRVLVPGGSLYCYKLPNRTSYLEFIARHSGMFFHGQAEFDRLYDLPTAVDMFRRHGFDVVDARLANMLPLAIPGRVTDALGAPIWRTSNGLSRLPGLKRLATNVELVARARPGSSASSSSS